MSFGCALKGYINVCLILPVKHIVSSLDGYAIEWVKTVISLNGYVSLFLLNKVMLIIFIYLKINTPIG